MAYGIKYYNSFTSSQFKEPITIQILSEGYIGVPTKKRIGATLHLGDSGDERWEPIKKTTATISLISETDQEFNEFFTNSDKKYQVRILRGLKPVLETPLLLWSGFIASDSYGEPYWTDRNYNISVTARDNLGTLADIKYLQSNGDEWEGLEKGSTIISRCLAETGLSLTISDQINIYSDTMSDIIPTLEQEYFNQDGYINDKGEIYSCLDVITNVLMGHGAQIRQSLGGWVIRELGNYYELNTINKGDGSYKWLNKSSELDFQPAWKEFTIQQDYKVPSSVIKVMPSKESDFTVTPTFLLPFAAVVNGWTYLNGTLTTIHYEDQGDNAIRFDRVNHVLGGTIPGYVWIERLFQIDATTSAVMFKFEVNTPSIEPSASLTLPIDIINGASILTPSGWVPYTNQERQLEFDITRNTPTELSVTADGIPNAGGIIIKLWCVNNEGKTEYRTFNVSLIHPDGENTTGANITANINTENNTTPDNIEIEVGQVPSTENAEIEYLGGVFDINGNAHINWHRKTYPLGIYPLLEVVARGYNTQYNKSAWQINGSVIWNFDMWTCINEDGHKMLLNSLDWAMFNDEANCEFIEVFEYDGTIDIIEQSQITDGDTRDFFQVNENPDYLAFTIDEGAPKRISDLVTETDLSNSFMIVDDATKSESKKIPVTSVLHIEKGRDDNVLGYPVTITFIKTFSSLPVITLLRVYRWLEIIPGNYQMQDVLYKFTSATPLTTSSLVFEIDSSENLVGVIIEYVIQ